MGSGSGVGEEQEGGAQGASLSLEVDAVGGGVGSDAASGSLEIAEHATHDAGPTVTSRGPIHPLRGHSTGESRSATANVRASASETGPCARQPQEVQTTTHGASGQSAIVVLLRREVGGFECLCP